MSMDINRLPMRRTDIEVHQFTDEYVLHDEQNGKIHVLNPTAFLIWTSCDGVSTSPEVLEKLRKEFDNTKKIDLDADLREIVGQLREKRLLADSDS